MKLRPFRVFSLVILGVLTSYGVAWFAQPDTSSPLPWRNANNTQYSVSIYRGTGWRVQMVARRRSEMEIEELLVSTDLSLESAPYEEGASYRRGWGSGILAGWPRLCVQGWAALKFEDPNPDYSVSQGLLLPDMKDFKKSRMPYLPRWPGLIVNTIFYAALWWLTFFVFRSARRAYRARRDRCIHCNYSLVGLPPISPCPECGTLPKPRKPSPATS